MRKNVLFGMSPIGRSTDFDIWVEVNMNNKEILLKEIDLELIGFIDGNMIG